MSNRSAAASRRPPGHRRRARPPRNHRRAIVGTVAGVAAAAGLAALLHGQSSPAGAGGRKSVSADQGTAPAATASRPAAARPSPSHTPAVKAVPKPTASAGGGTVRSTEALRDAVAQARGATSVAVTDLTTGKTLDYGAAGHGFACASIAKLDVLAALLLQAQDRRTPLTASEGALATKMIEHSDNAAADSLYTTLGKAPAMDAANKRFGLTSTHSGQGILWGVTTTTAADQVQLLRQVFTGSSVLDTASRSYIQGLLGRVENDQRWGVSAAATGGYELKNGWLPRSATGLWVVNSTGRIDHDGHRLLITVLSDGNTNESQGISLIQSVAEAAAAALVRG